MKKKNTGFIITIVILILLLLGSCGYILYDKGLIIKKESYNEDTKKVEKEDKEEELDINSILVQSLYSKVSPIMGDTISWNKYWYYTDIGNQEVNFINNSLDDFNVNTTKTNIKMQLVGLSLSEHEKQYVECSDKIDIIKNNGHSACYYAKHPDDNMSTIQYGYKREYVENKYKELFGDKIRFDTSAEIYMDYYGGVVLYYNEALDMYLEYYTPTGDTSGPGGFKKELTKATKKGKELKLYEKVETYEADDNQTEASLANTSTLVYTFELGEDGQYFYVSRTKEK